MTKVIDVAIQLSTQLPDVRSIEPIELGVVQPLRTQKLSGSLWGSSATVNGN